MSSFKWYAYHGLKTPGVHDARPASPPTIRYDYTPVVRQINVFLIVNDIKDEMNE